MKTSCNEIKQKEMKEFYVKHGSCLHVDVLRFLVIVSYPSIPFPVSQRLRFPCNHAVIYFNGFTV